MERGIGTSRGIGIGHVIVVDNGNFEISRLNNCNPETEKLRFYKAREQFMTQTENMLSEL